MKTNPCIYFFEHSPDVLKKKTKVLDIFITGKKCFIKTNIESSPQKIWIRIRLLKMNGSPSLINIIILDLKLLIMSIEAMCSSYETTNTSKAASKV